MEPTKPQTATFDAPMPTPALPVVLPQTQAKPLPQSSASRIKMSPSFAPIVDRCVIVLTLLTAISLVIGNQQTRTSHSQELLSLAVLTTAD